MIHYSGEVLLKEVCDSESGHNLPTVLVEITATVLDQEVGSRRLSSTCVWHGYFSHDYLLVPGRRRRSPTGSANHPRPGG